MAAVIGRVVCVYPCRACDKACEAMGRGCQAVGRCLAPVCRAAGECCTRVGVCLSAVAAKMCSEDFSGFLWLTFLCCFVPFVLAVYAAVALPDCGSEFARTWLYVQAALLLANVVAGAYIFHQLTRGPRDAAEAEQRYGAPPHGSGDEGGDDIGARARYLLCYDPWIALYILVLVFEFVWVFIGVDEHSKGTVADCDDALSHNLFGWCTTLGLVYVSLSLLPRLRLLLL